MNNYGTITNNGITTNNSFFENHSLLYNNFGGTFNNSGPMFNYDTVDNSGILNNSVFLINSGTLNNNSGGILNNSGYFLDNSGTLNNYSGAALHNTTALYNSGTLYNYSGGTVDNSGYFENSSTMYNIGAFYNSSSLLNIGVLENSGTLYTYSGGILDNNGTLTNNGTLSTSGILNVKTGGTLNGNGAVFVADGGAMNVESGGVLENSSLDILSGGTANIYGSAAISAATTVAGTLAVNNGGSLASGSLDILSGGAMGIDGTTTITNATTVAGTFAVNNGGSLASGSLDILAGGGMGIDGTTAITGATTVAGTLAVNSGGSLTSGSLDILSGGTMGIDGTTTITDATTVAGTLAVNSGGSLASGSLDILSGGTMNVASNGFVDVGSTTTIDGILCLNGTLTSPTVAIGQPGLLAGNGTINGDLSNAGTISPGNSIGMLTVNGNYSGSGILAMEVDFSSSSADRIMVTGNLSANGTIAIDDITQGTSGNSSEMQLIVATTDADKSDESFVLADDGHRYNGQTNLGRWVGSPYIWKLKTTGNNWVLGDAFEVTPPTPPATKPPAETRTETSKPAVVSEIPAYISLPTFSYEVVMNKMETLQQRMGELRTTDMWPVGDSAVKATPISINGWVRPTISGFRFNADHNFETDGHFSLVEFGFDRRVDLNEGNVIYPGIFAGYTNGDFENDGGGNTFGSLYRADTEINGWSYGAYFTWFNKNGYYADLVLDYMELDADIEAVDHYSTNGTMFGSSVELGRSFLINPQLVVEPQAEFKVASVKWDSFHDGWNEVAFEDHTYLTGRFGVRAEKTVRVKSGSVFKPWIYAGIQHEFTDSPSVNYIVDFASHQYDTTGNLQAGVTWHISDRLLVYSDMGYTSDQTDYHAYRIDLGLRLMW